MLHRGKLNVFIASYNATSIPLKVVQPNSRSKREQQTFCHLNFNYVLSFFLFIFIALSLSLFMFLDSAICVATSITINYSEVRKGRSADGLTNGRTI